MNEDQNSGLGRGSSEHHDVWQQVMSLFDLMVDNPNPSAVLEAEPDPEVRNAASQLWSHHLSATRENFLGNAVEFTVMPVFAPSQVLLDRFEVQSMLGKGGMGEVYLARDRKLGDMVALKTITRLLAPSRQIRRRFIAEVQNARRITHPNVCRIHELFDEGETVFFAMEYVRGTPLGDCLKPDGLSKSDAREVIAQLAEGLDAAHRGGVVHGDFKPANVLVVQPTIRAVIMDFGLARALQSTTEESAGESMGAGTLDYMAPELVAGSPPSIASDIYAFGKVAEQLLPGGRLWKLCTREHAGERQASLTPVIRKLRQDRTRRYWIGGATLAAAATPLYYLLNPPQPPVRIEAGARILVNGFQAAERILASARLARSILITALQQSPQLRTITDQELLVALQRLSPGKTLPVDNELLPRLVESQRATHWIDGIFKEANGRASLVLRIWRSADHRLHAETAFGDSPKVATLAEQTAVWVRQMAGESRRSLDVNSPAVTTYTSATPEALQKYYDGMAHYSLGQMDLAVPLLEEAVGLDPYFAQARSVLAMCWNARRRHVEAMEEVERAWKLSANLPLREKAWIESNYQELARDPVKMVESSRINLDYNSDEPRFYRVYGQSLCLAGRPADSIQFFQRAVDLAPQNDLLRNELSLALSESGRFDEALAVAQDVTAQSRNPELGRGLGLALLGQGRHAEAYDAFEHVPDDSRLLQAGARILPGDTDSALVALRQEASAQDDGQNPTARHRAHEFLCGTYFLIDRLDMAATHVRMMLPLPECPMLAQRFQCTAFWAARIGDDTVLAAASVQLQHIASRWPNGYTRAVSLHASALQAWRRKEMQAVETELVESLGAALTIWALFDLADFFAATGRPALAEEYWRKFEERQGTVLRRWFPGTVLYGWLNRGLAARMRGDRKMTVVCAKKILHDWARRHPGLRMVKRAEELAA